MHTLAGRTRSEAVGFTLLEIVIVLAVIGAMAATLAPRVFVYLDTAKRTQAQNDANQIADAISTFYEHTALPPYKNKVGTTKVASKEAADFDCLYGTGSIPVAATDTTTGTSWVTICGAAGARDTIENHLIKNTPGGVDATKAYATTGKNAWRGPYIPSVPTDPWGSAYLVNIGKADPSAATKKAVWVISPGSNGRWETLADLAATSSLSASGDDIVARVK